MKPHLAKKVTRVTVTNYLMKMIRFLACPGPSPTTHSRGALHIAIKHGVHRLSSRGWLKCATAAVFRPITTPNGWTSFKELSYYLLRMANVWCKVGCLSIPVPPCLFGSASVSLSRSETLPMHKLSFPSPRPLNSVLHKLLWLCHSSTPYQLWGNFLFTQSSGKSWRTKSSCHLLSNATQWARWSQTSGF